MPVHLIRHPAPDVAAGMCYGHSDIALVEPVEAMLAALLPQLLQQLPTFSCLYSSPLQRCMRLAVALGEAAACPVIPDERLMEMNFGRWEMQRWDSLGAACLDDWIASDYSGAAHGGEDLLTFQARALDWLRSLPADEDCVAVSHAGLIRVLLAHQNAWPLPHCLQLPLAFGSITRLESGGGAYK